MACYVFKDNPEAVFSVRLLPRAFDVKLIKSSGVAAYDAAVERAIRAADPVLFGNSTALQGG